MVRDRRSLIVAGQGSHGGGWGRGGVVVLGLAGARAFVKDEQRRGPLLPVFPHVSDSLREADTDD